MARRRVRSMVAAAAIMMMIATSLFTGPALARSGDSAVDDESRAVQQAGFASDFVCRSNFTFKFRLVFTPSCNPNETLIQISASLPFDYCYDMRTGVMGDDLFNNTCPPGQIYFVEDGSTSFFVCYNIYTGQILHITNPAACPFGTPNFFVDLRGDLTKYACVEENLHPDFCDIFPAGGVQNEIRQLTPVDPFPFAARTFKLEFRGARTAALSPFVDRFDPADSDTTAANIEAALAALPTIGLGNVSVTALDPGELWTTSADIFTTPEDESTSIRVEFTGALGGQDITDPILLVEALSITGAEESTVIDGSLNSPGLNNVMPGGTVEIFHANAATDPNNPATFGASVTGGPQPVDASGSFTRTNLFEGDYVVCADGTGSVSPSCELFTINANVVTLVNNVDLPGTISAALTSLGTNEIQTFNDFDGFPGFVSGGTYTITFDGSTTGALAFDANAATIEAALEALASINGDNVTVTGGPPNQAGPEVVIEFINALGNLDVPSITIDNSNLTGGGGFFKGYFVNVNLTDVDGSGAQHTLTADARVSGGTFTLSFGGDTTVPLDFDATVTEIETELNNLPSINATGSVSVVSTDPDFIPGNETILKAPIVVGFSNVPGSEVDGSLTVDNTNLT